MIKAVLWIAIAIVIGSAFGAVGEEGTSCSVCHSRIRVEYRESVHTNLAITCVDCHGGDGTVTGMEAMAPETGFKGRPKRSGIPELCASCHADPVAMRSYDIPTDQYAQYRTSQHGIRLAAGDTDVAVCTDCHTAHRILSPEEPRSSVYPENVPETCARCHADTTLMAYHGISSDPFEQFTESVHGVALLKEENRKAPNCATCHGVHGTGLPDVKGISEVCDQCHLRTRQQLREGPHKQAMDQETIPECVSCHGDHAIREVNHELFETACIGCHARGSDAFAAGQRLKTLLVEAEAAVDRAEAERAEVERLGFDTSTYRSRLYQANTALTQALPMQHSLDEARVEELTRQARSIGEQVWGEIHGLQGATRFRLVGLSIFWVYVLSIVLVIYLYRRGPRRR
ncbi:MAG: cytochrome c3 family protein [Candidatus Bipolaricaulia bacterium]